MARGQRMKESRLPPFTWISHDTMQVLQAYFAGVNGASLAQGLALYMGIAYLLSSEKKDGEHKAEGQWTRTELAKVCGVSPAGVTRYADHLEAAGVIAVERVGKEDGRQGHHGHIWRLVDVEPPIREERGVDQREEAPLITEERPSEQGDHGPAQPDEAIDGEKKNGKKTDTPPEGSPEQSEIGTAEQLVRATKFCRWLSRQVDEESKDTYPDSQLEAAIWLLDHKPHDELRSVVEWAVTRQYWPSQVRTAGRLKHRWDDVRADWRGATANGAGGNSRTAAKQERTKRRMEAIHHEQ